MLDPQADPRCQQHHQSQVTQTKGKVMPPVSNNLAKAKIQPIPKVKHDVSKFSLKHNYGFTVCRHVYSNTGSSPSPFSSPMQSPLSSPHVSPSTSHYSSRSGSPWSNTGKFEISAWLKQARLHKYQEGLDGYTLEEVTCHFCTDQNHLLISLSKTIALTHQVICSC